MNKPLKIQEIIVVEGRSDTQNLARAVNADTIETGGSAINSETIDRIKLAMQERGVIVLTDPDFNGNRIRHIITQHVPNVWHAYITQDEGRAAKDNPHKSLGVEHASPIVLQRALASVAHHQMTNTAIIDMDILQALGLVAGTQAKARRSWLGDKLHIGYSNGKQLQKRLQQYNIDAQQLKTTMAQYEEI